MKDTKERILSEGLDLLTQTGFANVTVGALAQRTGMSKSGMFAHFGSKEEVQLKLLEETLRVGAVTFIEPAMRNPPGLARLRAIVHGWFGWTENAGLHGGCPIASGLFEFDDAPKNHPVRKRLLVIEQQWRNNLAAITADAVHTGELLADLDVNQFVWELCGIYLNHHVSHRFINDPIATGRAHIAFEGLLRRSLGDNAKITEYRRPTAHKPKRIARQQKKKAR
jgi:AcrR family transcriptional regulator